MRFRRSVVVLSILSLSTLLGAQATTCAEKSRALPVGIQTLEGTAEHDQTITANPPNPPGVLNDHHVTASPIASCTYSHGNTGLGSCDTVCAVVTTPVVEKETVGTLVQGTSGFHQVNHVWNDGGGTTFSGPQSCSASFGGGAINCGAALGIGCAFSVKVSSGVVDVSTDDPKAHPIWTSDLKTYPLTCPAVTDPQVPSAPHFVPPDPCLDGPAIVPLGGGQNAVNNPDCSPILIDTGGTGITLVRPEFGPHFDLTGGGVKSVVSWTGFDEKSVGFLVLDRNGNGAIDNGTELFGNFTAQPDSPNKNGFAALAEFDKPENGGNGDGVISALDAVWPKLMIWIDSNHNGVSEPRELKPLSFYHIEALELKYQEDRHVDQWGNAFRYKAKVISDNSGPGKSLVGRWAYDVFLSVLDLYPDQHKK